MIGGRERHAAVIGGGWIDALGGFNLDGFRELDSVERAAIGRPTVTALSPSAALNNVATSVTVTGTNLLAITRAHVNNLPLDSVTGVTSATLTAAVPVGAPAGPYSLTVTSAIGFTATLANVITISVAGDGSLGLWRADQSLTTARGEVAAVAANGYVYAVGGKDGVNSYLNSGERAATNPDGSLGAWQVLTATMTTTRSPVSTEPLVCRVSSGPRSMPTDPSAPGSSPPA